MFNRTLKVGPSFCGKAHLLLSKLQVIHLDTPEKQMKSTTRSPEQYTARLTLHEDIEDFSVEEDLEDRTIPKALRVQDYQNCCVVFDVMLDSNRKLIDPFFTRG